MQRGRESSRQLLEYLRRCWVNINTCKAIWWSPGLPSYREGDFRLEKKFINTWLLWHLWKKKLTQLFSISLLLFIYFFNSTHLIYQLLFLGETHTWQSYCPKCFIGGFSSYTFTTERESYVLQGNNCNIVALWINELLLGVSNSSVSEGLVQRWLRGVRII